MTAICLFLPRSGDKMTNTLRKEDYLIQIRDKLRRDGIKLWLPPYFKGSNASEDDIKNLSEDFSKHLNIPPDICQEIIKDLQNNALENLKQKNHYKESGLATIKIKILHKNSPPRLIQKELLLSMITNELKDLVRNEISVSSEGQCNSQLLKTVDNYALLDLDIAWCYLCLESFVQLPEAESRLKRCEEKFHSTYGNNLERLVAVKGTPGNEEALFMRLHLLQAIVLYHQNKRAEALLLLRKVEEEINSLKVDDDSVVTLIELGYSSKEATLGLRAARGNVNEAANYINENREKRAEGRKKAEAEAILEKERKKLGLCNDGKQYVDPRFVKILVNMGYNKEAARVALKNTNNIISDSIQYIQENPLPGSSNSKSTEMMSFVDDLTKQLEEAGFDPRMAKLALSKHSGDIQKAAEELIANDGIIQGDLSNRFGAESLDNIKKRRQEDKEKNEAFQRLKEDIDIVDDDYLDINLVQEEIFLKEYLSLLNE
ncbi:NEDD8 ultimate buster 1-like isoform X2 [Diabrotica undecimpunctata]|uniref:NEDD8 ultimate buster 1-like isoform X2 n=1 Tax=Diabrotica undecimpunctata TaxID=50387 RepID=UPI003B63ED6A